MKRLEDELKKALQRVDPPAGFAQRVLANAAKQKQKGKRARSWFVRFGPAALRWALAGALCVVLASSGLLYRHEERKRGEAAKEQLMLALRITSSKLQIVAQNVRELNSREQPQP